MFSSGPSDELSLKAGIHLVEIRQKSMHNFSASATIATAAGAMQGQDVLTKLCQQAGLQRILETLLQCLCQAQSSIRRALNPQPTHTTPHQSTNASTKDIFWRYSSSNNYLSAFIESTRMTSPRELCNESRSIFATESKSDKLSSNNFSSFRSSANLNV